MIVIEPVENDTQISQAESATPEEKPLSQGSRVFLLGLAGVVFGIAPAIFYAPPFGILIGKTTYFVFGFAPGIFLIPSVKLIVLIAWASIVGVPFTGCWSKAIHDRLEFVKGPTDKSARRILWIPAWIGVFERLFYSALIGSNVSGGATLIGVWIGLKSAGGWQRLSEGTTYGRAIFFCGLTWRLHVCVIRGCSGLGHQILSVNP